MYPRISWGSGDPDALSLGFDDDELRTSMIVPAPNVVRGGRNRPGRCRRSANLTAVGAVEGCGHDGSAARFDPAAAAGTRISKMAPVSGSDRTDRLPFHPRTRLYAMARPMPFGGRFALGTSVSTYDRGAPVGQRRPP